jgi:hypothetical protein
MPEMGFVREHDAQPATAPCGHLPGVLHSTSKAVFLKSVLCRNVLGGISLRQIPDQLARGGLGVRFSPEKASSLWTRRSE